MVDSHHEAAAQTHQADDGLERSSVRPEIHDANLGLSEPVRGLDNGLEIDPLLQKIEVTIGDRDCVQVVVGGGELDSLAREGIQRLEEELAVIVG